MTNMAAEETPLITSINTAPTPGSIIGNGAEVGPDLDTQSHGVLSESEIIRVLPIAFMAAFAIAATSATSVFAYASLTCKDATDCQEKETQQFAGIVAIATTVANVCGVVSIGLLRRWSESHPKAGLMFWLICRSTGVAFLLLAVSIQSIQMAIVGKLFDGLASDNILHYTLGAVYVQTKIPSRFSLLMGTSLALYMAAMSISPTLVTLLQNFTWSFFVAIAVLGVSLLYLTVSVPSRATKPRNTSRRAIEDTTKFNQGQNSAIMQWWLSCKTILNYYRENTKSLFPALAIFFYNAAQAYLFPAIMVHAAVKFGFTSMQNGYIISIAAATSSVYLFFVLFAIPRLQDRLGRGNKAMVHDGNADVEEADSVTPRKKRTSDLENAFVSMLVQLLVLPCFKWVRNPNQLYGLTVFVALGLAAPSFIKSHAVASAANEKNMALAGMAAMESLGGLMSSLLLGTVQALLKDGNLFFVASSLVGAGMLCLVIGDVLRRRSVVTLGED